MNWKVTQSLPISFEIFRSQDALSFNKIDIDRKLIVIDLNFYNLYCDKIIIDKNTKILTIECLESTKDWKTAESILDFFEKNDVLRRSEPIIAIGGGVLLDIVGFCCSIYRRGIPYIRIPTTLLSLIDASIGIKTSINHFNRRNRFGSFYPPLYSIIDNQFIKTQDDRQISNGVAEMIKLSIVTDQELFLLLEKNVKELMEQRFQGNIANQTINIAIGGMLSQLTSNLWETNLERPVDFGHSFSPIIEMKNVDDLLHGEAVILDCLLSSCIAFIKNMICEDVLIRIFKLIQSYTLPTYHTDFFDIDLLNIALSDTKKHRNGNIFLPLPTAIGSCNITNNLTDPELLLAILKMKELNARF